MDREKLRKRAMETLDKAVAKWMREDPQYAASVMKFAEISKPILEDLSKAGYQVDNLDEMRQMRRPWKTAVPILLRWLALIDAPDVQEAIVRCLAVPWVYGQGTAQLIQEFKRAPSGSSLAWAIGNALSVVSAKGFEKQLMDLCADKRFGTARQMIVYGLYRLHIPEAEAAAVDLLDDEDVKLHAIYALGRMKSKRSLFALERLLTDKEPGVRKEVRKVITKISRSL